jgi:hypothetical protein
MDHPSENVFQREKSAFKDTHSSMSIIAAVSRLPNHSHVKVGVSELSNKQEPKLRIHDEPITHKNRLPIQVGLLVPP